jgi:large subunit ribosomal protein L9
MDVILLERIAHLGQMGDVVRVKPGYARNYLLPQRKALRASKDNMSYFEKQRAQLEAVNLHRRSEAEAAARKMEGVSVIVLRQAGEGGQLYGSVSARDVAQALTEAGYTVDRNQVQIDRPIKSLGLFDLRIQLHPEVEVTVTVNVARTREEAELQAQRGGMVAGQELEPEPSEPTELFAPIERDESGAAFEPGATPEHEESGPTI